MCCSGSVAAYSLVKARSLTNFARVFGEADGDLVMPAQTVCADLVEASPSSGGEHAWRARVGLNYFQGAQMPCSTGRSTLRKGLIGAFSFLTLYSEE